MHLPLQFADGAIYNVEFWFFLHWIMLSFWECLSYIHSIPLLIKKPILLYGSIPNLPLLHLLLFLQHLWINLANLLLLQFAHQHSLHKLCKLLVPKPRAYLFIWDLFLHLLYVFSVGLITLHSPSWCIGSHKNFPQLIWIFALPMPALLLFRGGA